jgi:hypothetical protein
MPCKVILIRTLWNWTLNIKRLKFFIMIILILRNLFPYDRFRLIYLYLVLIWFLICLGIILVHNILTYPWTSLWITHIVSFIMLKIVFFSVIKTLWSISKCFSTPILKFISLISLYFSLPLVFIILWSEPFIISISIQTLKLAPL